MCAVSVLLLQYHTFDFHSMMYFVLLAKTLIEPVLSQQISEFCSDVIFLLFFLHVASSDVKNNSHNLSYVVGHW